ncbi:MAG: RelA/SpoT family protein [Bacteroidota bacterium]|nr:RelA/SpoT family protein [Bacteroidota bacterium]
MKRKITEEEKKLIISHYKKLISACDFATKQEKVLIRRAYDHALSKYADRTIETGEFQMAHTASIATIVASEIGLKSPSVIATLLQDLAPDKEKELAEIRKEFGDTVANLVESLHKVSNLQTEKIENKSENFIKYLLSIADDVKVVLIKLADRLHYMRMLDALPETKRKKIASETKNLYTPLAHRLGLYKIKTELEELSMKYGNPDAYFEILRKLEASKVEQGKYMKAFIEPITAELDLLKFDYEIKWRTKAVSSIYQKMLKQQVPFEEVFDIFAVRIIINCGGEDEKINCWHVYSIVTNLYKPNLERMRDWITSPRENGYESLHATVLGAQDKWVEVQIRTRRMDENAEKGIAAHWRYKESKKNIESDSWLNLIREMMEKESYGEDGHEEDSKIETNIDKIYVFTPQGDLIRLSANATVLDFAFAVHSNIGAHCTGARVNGQIVPLKYVLKNGDQVLVLTSKNQKPNLDWLNWVNTPRAKAKVKRALKEIEYKKAEEGREILKRKIGQLKLTYTDELVQKLFAYFKCNSALDFYQAIADEKVTSIQIRDALITPVKEEVKAVPPRILPPTKALPAESSHIKKQNLIIINDDSEIEHYKLARCCNPVFGDPIFGFVTVGEGLKIHRDDCPNARQLINRFGYRVVKARWVEAEPGQVTMFTADVLIQGTDQLGIVNEISRIISNEMQITIRSISIESKPNSRFEGKVKVAVQNAKHLDFLITKLRKLDGVVKANWMHTNE